MKIAVIMASRGLVFSKTMETVFDNINDNLVGNTFKLFMAHDLPIPDCFNVPLLDALASKPDVVWFVEEDMVIGQGTLAAMLKEFNNGYKFITGEYVDRRTGANLICRNEKGVVIYTGMGCLLIDVKIFDKLPQPYLQQKCFVKVKTAHGNDYKMIKGKVSWYGTQDAYLSCMVRKLGYEIKVVKTKIGHLQLLEKGKDEKNAGQHKIKEFNLADCKAENKMLDTIGFWFHTDNNMLVKVNHTGGCMGYNYTKDQPINLPEEVIGAIGADNVTAVAEPKKHFKPTHNTAIKPKTVKQK